MIDYVREHADRFGVEPILAALKEHGIGVAPSTYYAHTARGFAPTPSDLADAYLADKLFDLRMGSVRLRMGSVRTSILRETSTRLPPTNAQRRAPSATPSTAKSR